MERGSRFIAEARRTSTVEAARAFIEEMRDAFPDATHHCYAYVVGFGANVTEGMSDDGEPTGTAGKPMLAVLRGADVGDVSVVVVRYFGGTKLGTGGLVRAYTAATQAVMGRLETELKIEWIPISISMEYSMYEPVQRLVELHDGRITGEEFMAEVSIAAEVPSSRIEELQHAVSDATSGTVEVKRMPGPQTS